VGAKSKSVKKAVVATFCVIATLWVLGSIALYSVMRRPPQQFGRVMAKISGPIPFLIFPFETLWMRARAGTLQVGSPAPDFLLGKLDKTAQIQLSALTAQQRPVVLVFGSYT
jgi:hypothetical protein